MLKGPGRSKNGSQDQHVFIQENQNMLGKEMLSTYLTKKMAHVQKM